jgi:hypothetical protein
MVRSLSAGCALLVVSSRPPTKTALTPCSCVAVERACCSCSSASIKPSTRRSPWASSPTRSTLNSSPQVSTSPLCGHLPPHTCQHGIRRRLTSLRRSAASQRSSGVGVWGSWLGQLLPLRPIECKCPSSLQVDTTACVHIRSITSIYILVQTVSGGRLRVFMGIPKII